MNYAELLEKYNSLLKEIQKLQTENNQLKDQLSKTKQPEECNLNVSDSEIGQLSFLIPLLSGGRTKKVIRDIRRFAVMNGRAGFVLNLKENALNVSINLTLH